DELLGHAGHADTPAGAGMLEDLERPVWGRVHDRVADIREVGDALPVYEAVAPAALRAALDRMARDRPGGEEVPGVWPPPKGMNQGREGESGVGDASRDDHVRASAQRVHDRPGAEIGVGREDAVAHVGQGTAG